MKTDGAINLSALGRACQNQNVDTLASHGALPGLIKEWTKHGLEDDSEVQKLIKPAPLQQEAIKEKRGINEVIHNLLDEAAKCADLVANIAARLDHRTLPSMDPMQTKHKPISLTHVFNKLAMSTRHSSWHYKSSGHMRLSLY